MQLETVLAKACIPAFIRCPLPRHANLAHGSSYDPTPPKNFDMPFPTLHHRLPILTLQV